MSSGVVVELLPRLLRRPLRMTSPAETDEEHTYQRAAIRGDVCPVTLARALAGHRLMFTVDESLGIVIKPMPDFMDAS